MEAWDKPKIFVTWVTPMEADFMANNDEPILKAALEKLKRGFNINVVYIVDQTDLDLEYDPGRWDKIILKSDTGNVIEDVVAQLNDLDLA